jgi:molybdopterin molybdotransferase
MARNGWLKLIPADDARQILLATPPVGTEVVPLAEAGGRVLADALVAPHDLPPQRRSAMDGYAVVSHDVAQASELQSVVLRVIGSVAAGGGFAGSVASGEAVAIATGGPIPDGADAVVMVEHTATLGGTGDGSGGGARVEVSRACSPGTNVVQIGEDLRSGDQVLAAGRRLRAFDLAALATFGVTEVAVFRRPRIAILSTGSELCRPSEVPQGGQVRDVNQVVLAAAVASTGAQPVPAGIVPDELGPLGDAVRRLVAEHDGVILSGGSSVGSKDFTGRILGDLGAPGVLFHGIDIRPGKPTVFARVGVKPVVGMPGYPTSAIVVFEAFIRPMLARLGGEAVTEPWPARVRARLARAYEKPAAREDYLRVRLSERDGELWCTPLAGGSAALSNVLAADGLARAPAGTERLDEGAWLPVRLL